jgi:hypothetical protein
MLCTYDAVGSRGTPYIYDVYYDGCVMVVAVMYGWLTG